MPKAETTTETSHDAIPVAIVGLLLLFVGVFQIGSGVIAALVPIKLADAGFLPSVVGWVSTAFSVGFLAGCMAGPAIISALRIKGSIVATAAISAAVAVVLGLTVDPWIWALARGASGVAMAALLILVEAWLATVASRGTRATIFGVYMVVSRLSFVVGQVALALIDPTSALLIAVAAVSYAVSPGFAFAIPGQGPVIGRKSGPDLRDLPFAAPAAAMASFMHGLIGSTGPALLPLFALARGLDVDQVALLLSAMPIGGLLFQIPFSRLSDRFGRRTMMAVSALATMGLSAVYLLPELPPFGWLMVLTTLWGGAPAALYLLAVAHANDIATDAQRIGWSSTLLLLWGIGAAIGPLAASILMERMGYGALFVFTGGMAALLCIFLLVRKLIRKRHQRTPASETIGPAPGAGG